jgi:hypothetical protein
VSFRTISRASISFIGDDRKAWHSPFSERPF